jgi:hypothetical protein
MNKIDEFVKNSTQTSYDGFGGTYDVMSINDVNSLIQLVRDEHKHKWIQVSEDLLPKRNTIVDIFDGKRRITDFAYMAALGEFRSITTGIVYKKDLVTHFMYKPEAPSYE